MADEQDFEGSGLDISESEGGRMVEGEEGLMQRLLDVLTEERSWQETVRLATTLASLVFLILSLILNLYIIVNICCKKRIQVFCRKGNCVNVCFENLLVLFGQIYCNGSCTCRLSGLLVSFLDRLIIPCLLFQVCYFSVFLVGCLLHLAYFASTSLALLWATSSPFVRSELGTQFAYF